MTKVLMDKQFELEFREEFSAFMKRKQSYENNRIKAYPLIWERCAKGMKTKIKARSDFKETINYIPIELLRAIKQHSII